MLERVEGLDASVLCDSYLAGEQLPPLSRRIKHSLISAPEVGLKSLHLETPLSFNLGRPASPLIASLQLPFTLDAIGIIAWGAEDLTPLASIARLLAKTTRVAAISLEDGLPPKQPAPICSPPAPNRLLELNLQATRSQTFSGILRSLEPFFRQCHRLRHLASSLLHGPLLEYLPARLEQLSLYIAENSVPKVALLLRLELPALQRLKDLELNFASNVPPPPPELERECSKRAIQLTMRQGEISFSLMLC